MYIKGLNKDKFLPEEISSYKFGESLCGFFDAILKMISPAKFSIRCKQKPDSKPKRITGDPIGGFRYEKIGQMQESKQTAKQKKKKKREIKIMQPGDLTSF